MSEPDYLTVYLYAHEMARKDIVKLKDENARLQAEVERLESDLKMEKENEDRLVRLWQTANNEVHGQRSQIAALIDNQTRLKAEVERLEHLVNYWRIEAETDNARWLRCLEDMDKLRKACKLVFDESAKRKFLMCYPGNDFYVSKEAMEAMSVALGYSKAKEGKQS